jgi:RNA polymerase sigma-70 factor (ECF subfamily)
MDKFAVKGNSLNMRSHVEEFKAEIEKALESLVKEGHEKVVNQIRPILFANLDRGRIHGFTEDEIERVQEYVNRVFQTYSDLNLYIRSIQIERSTIAWTPLFKKMQTWAYHFFLGKNFYPGEATQEIASGCATEAAINLLNAYFPYDADFEPWVCIIVQNTCLKWIKKETAKSVVPLQKIIEIDETLDNLEDPTLLEERYQVDLVGELLEAVAKLSNERRQVIELFYLNDLSSEEIAKKMGKSVGAIYNLKFNALNDLRKILDKKKDNINGRKQ